MNTVKYKKCIAGMPGFALIVMMAFACLTYDLRAQAIPDPAETPAPARIHELGLSFSRFRTMGLSYRVGTEKALWRIGIPELFISLSDASRDSISFERKELISTFSFGREWRRPLGKQLILRTGYDISLGLGLEKRMYPAGDNTRISVAPGVNAVLGVGYLVKGKLMLGAELNPGLRTGFSLFSSRRLSFPRSYWANGNLDLHLNISPMLSACLRF